MNANDIGYLPGFSLIPNQVVSASANGASVDIKDYVGNLKIMLDAGAGTGTTPTLLASVQDSPDNVTFTDVPLMDFTLLTTVASIQSLVLNTDAVNRYIRIALTLTGTTPAYPVSVQGVGVKQVFP